MQSTETAMRVSKEKAEQNRAAIVDAAAALFRARGYEGVGLNEVMSAAGFTHGGFYNHFESKEALAAEACRMAFAQSTEQLNKELGGAVRRGGHEVLLKALDTYLSPSHRDDRAGGCPMASFAADAARAEPELQKAYASGVDALLRIFEEQLRLVLPGKSPKAQKKAAAALMSQIVGAMVLSRAVQQADPALSDEFLSAARDSVRKMPSAKGVRPSAKGTRI